MKARTIPEANRDAASASWELERMRKGWGDALKAEVRRAVAAIRANPRMYPRTEDGPNEPENREFYIARFEYRVIYAVWQEELVIVAVIHASRHPSLWVPRLDDLTPPEDPT
jgi:plasmid stabilization system protein ParE